MVKQQSLAGFDVKLTPMEQCRIPTACGDRAVSPIDAESAETIKNPSIEQFALPTLYSENRAILSVSEFDRFGCFLPNFATVRL
jgi:hypothetical protein